MYLHFRFKKKKQQKEISWKLASLFPNNCSVVVLITTVRVCICAFSKIFCYYFRSVIITFFLIAFHLLWHTYMIYLYNLYTIYVQYTVCYNNPSCWWISICKRWVIFVFKFITITYAFIVWRWKKIVLYHRVYTTGRQRKFLNNLRGY